MGGAPEHHAASVCPICGEPAEAGCLYGRDSGWIGLRWRTGDPSLIGNFLTGVGGGDAVGEHEMFSGPFARGVRCDRCRRIVLEV